MPAFLPRKARLLTTTALLLAACGGADEPPAEESAPAAAPSATTQEPQRIDIRDLGYALGSADAPVTVVEFSDLGCPYCAKFALETYPELHEEFVETGRVRWQYVPFVLGIFPNGEEAARAAECAGEQDDFWPMHDLLYQRQREWKSSDSPEELFNGYARTLELNEERFASCYGENRPGSRIQLHNQVAQQLGVRATPSFLVNGRPVEGALPAERFRMLLEWAESQQQEEGA